MELHCRAASGAGKEEEDEQEEEDEGVGERRKEEEIEEADEEGGYEVAGEPADGVVRAGGEAGRSAAPLRLLDRFSALP